MQVRHRSHTPIATFAYMLNGAMRIPNMVDGDVSMKVKNPWVCTQPFVSPPSRARAEIPIEDAVVRAPRGVGIPGASFLSAVPVVVADNHNRRT